MSTRAIQIGFLLSGLIDPDTGLPLSGGKAKFYTAGTSTPKNVWTEKEKTNPYSEVTLSTGGISQLYGDGIYKILIYDSEDALKYTWDNVRLQYPNFSVVTKISTYTTTPDDDVILVNTASGDVTVNLHAASTWEHPLFIKNIGANNVIIDASGSETIDGSATFTIYGIYSDVMLYSSGSAIYTNYGTNTMTFSNEGLHILDEGGSYDLVLKAAETLTADRILSIVVNDGARTLTIEASSIIDQDLSADARPTWPGFNDGNNNIDFPTNGMAAAKFMLGDSNTIAWFYLNTAPPGWKALTTGADTVLGVSGGSQAYNVNGGSQAGTWTQPDHTLTVDEIPAHNHSIDSYLSYGTTYHEVGGISDKVDTGSVNTDSTGGGSAHNHGTTYRPSASVGKLFQLDTA